MGTAATAGIRRVGAPLELATEPTIPMTVHVRDSELKPLVLENNSTSFAVPPSEHAHSDTFSASAVAQTGDTTSTSVPVSVSVSPSVRYEL